jgi:hypothetical protein
MKKLFFIFLMVGIIAGCQKKATNSSPVKTQEVTFGVQTIDPSSLKSNADTWNCTDVIPDMAWIEIDGMDYYSQLFIVDGKLYTQAIQLGVGSHTVNNFVLYKESDGILGISASEEIAFGIPAVGSDYAVYVNSPVEFPIEVTSFAKAEVPVQVLCFNPDSYTEFGYDWFYIQRVVVRQQCFFGDFCTKHFAEYGQSDYGLQSTGLAMDMPAIFTIKAYIQNGDSWDLLSNGGIFTNDTPEANYGVGTPVCVEYPDNLSTTDNFKFELWILVKQGDAFNFVLFHTWYFSDDEMIPDGKDGVVDFELGNCNVGSADLQLAPYMNLPAQATLRTGGTVPGALTQPDGTLGYFDVTLSGIGTGFDIGNGGYPVNCMQRTVDINLNTTYLMNVESSLYPSAMMSTYAQNVPWDKINYLINHLADYPGRTWSDVQQAIWMVEDPTYDGLHTGSYLPDPITAVGLQMAADAKLLGGGFVPAPGDLAAVVFERVESDGAPVQIVIIKLDP